VRDEKGEQVRTDKGLLVFQMLPADMPAPAAAHEVQLSMFGGAQ